MAQFRMLKVWKYGSTPFKPLTKRKLREIQEEFKDLQFKVNSLEKENKRLNQIISITEEIKSCVIKNDFEAITNLHSIVINHAVVKSATIVNLEFVI